MLIQGIYILIHVLTKHVKDQTSICPAGSSSPESNPPTELISLSESSSSPASSAASLVAYFETYSGPTCQLENFLLHSSSNRAQLPLTLTSYVFGSRIRSAAASPFRGSVGFGYRRSCGRKTSNILIMSNMGDQVWLITSRQTDPELVTSEIYTLWDRNLISHLIDIWVKYAVDKADARTFVWILVRQFHVNLPQATFKRCYSHYEPAAPNALCFWRTFFRPFEPDVEFLPGVRISMSIGSFSEKSSSVVIREHTLLLRQRLLIRQNIANDSLLSLTKVTS